ncbi:MAG TPA: hypothetical protein VI759_00615 [Dehalococcoidia bacterium]|nr:hypothetical protein [Dehalococcoidia bacterium]
MKWIDLARAYHGDPRGEPFKDVLELAIHAVKNDLARFPLATMHYMETWKKRDEGSRYRLAEVMAMLSRFETMAGAKDIFKLEVDLALHDFFGLRRQAEETRIFGRGVAHAFGKHLEIQLPDHPEIPSFIQERIRFSLWRLKEFWVIGGYRPTKSIPAIDPQAYTGYSRDFQDAEQELVRVMKDTGATASERQNVALIRSLTEIWQLIQEFRSNEIDFEMLVSLGALGLKEFLRSMPSRFVSYELQRLRYEDMNLPRKDGDLIDLAALSFGIAYCDVVVTERQWQHLVKRTKLEELYGTVVLSDLRELSPILVRGSI